MSIEDFKNLTDEEKDKLRMEYVRETFDPAKFDLQEIEEAVQEQYRDVDEETILDRFVEK
jgi:hypothetical protein